MEVIMNLSELQAQIIEEFSFFEDWTEKYEYLIALGKTMPLIEEKNKTDENLIQGCQSKVWLFAEKKEDKIIFTADSDAIVTKGIVALLLRVYSHQTAEDILQTQPDFIEKIGLQEHLSPTRANGLLSMIKQIKLYALALKN